MFELLKLSIKDFRSYRGEHTFTFPKVNGLYFLTGKNLVEPALGSNGAGKSTLLEAITWALYGRTSRGLKGPEVLSDWGDASAAVELHLMVGDNHLTIKRGQKPNYLIMNGKPLADEELLNHIRLNFDSFIYSVINTQFGDSFMTLSPSAKLTLFSDIMNLEYWMDKSAQAGKRAVSLEVDVIGLTTSITKREAQLASLQEDLKLFGDTSKEFAERQKYEIDVLKQQIDKLKATSLENLPELSESFRVKLAKREREVDAWITNIQKAAREKSQLMGESKVFKEQIEENAKLTGKCPTCRQPIDKAATYHREVALTMKLNAVINSITAADEELDQWKAELVKAKHRVEVATETLNEIIRKETREKAKRDEIKNLKEKLVELRGKSNPYAELIQLKLVKEKGLKEGIKMDTSTKKLAEQEYAAVNYWPKGFKMIRLFVIEQAFRTLELEVNNTLAQLGMTDWQISFDVERENKSGGVTKGFITFIKGPNNAKPVRWENWSGGETQRLQLAGDLGLANLIMQQNGLTNVNEFYDEPSTHLSPEGMMDLADMLHERAVAEGKRIWIVDHASITNFGEFQGVITIRKDENGSRITGDCN